MFAEKSYMLATPVVRRCEMDGWNNDVVFNQRKSNRSLDVQQREKRFNVFKLSLLYFLRNLFFLTILFYIRAVPMSQ